MIGTILLPGNVYFSLHSGFISNGLVNTRNAKLVAASAIGIGPYSAMFCGQVQSSLRDEWVSTGRFVPANGSTITLAGNTAFVGNDGGPL